MTYYVSSGMSNSSVLNHALKVPKVSADIVDGNGEFHRVGAATDNLSANQMY